MPQAAIILIGLVILVATIKVIDYFKDVAYRYKESKKPRKWGTY